MKPLSRTDDLIIEEVGDELLIYDSLAHRGHTLGSDAAKVWRGCDGSAASEELSTKLGLERDTVARALEELAACDLLVDAPAPAEGSTRREATFKLAKVGAAAFAAPMIISVTAPVAAHAATNCQLKYTPTLPGKCQDTGCAADPDCICCTGSCLRVCRNNSQAEFDACHAQCPDHIFCCDDSTKCDDTATSCADPSCGACGGPNNPP